MKTITFAISLFLLVSHNVYSAPAMFAGWDEFCGIRVIVTPNPQSASASMDRFGPVIYADPSVMGNWSMSRVFTLAHECGHHRSGHVTPNGMWFRNTQFWATRAQELEADCWAAEALSTTRRYSDLDRTIKQFARQGNRMQGNYPSGMERANVIAECAGVDINKILGVRRNRNQNYNNFPTPQAATICSTSIGNCGMGQMIPVGSSCFCPSFQGPISGVAR